MRQSSGESFPWRGTLGRCQGPTARSGSMGSGLARWRWQVRSAPPSRACRRSPGAGGCRGCRAANGSRDPSQGPGPAGGRRRGPVGLAGLRGPGAWGEPAPIIWRSPAHAKPFMWPAAYDPLLPVRLKRAGGLLAGGRGAPRGWDLEELLAGLSPERCPPNPPGQAIDPGAGTGTPARRLCRPVSQLRERIAPGDPFQANLSACC